MARIRVCIDARLVPATAGGIEQFIIGLTHGTASLTETEQEYFVLTYPGVDDWIKPYLGDRFQILHSKTGPRCDSRWKAWLKRSAPQVQALYHRFGHRLCSLRLPESDGTIESAGIQVMHFTHQSAFKTSVPSIYHPHDLQHLHLPQFFTPRNRAGRELSYRSFCAQAQFVCVTSNWVRDDLVARYQLPAKKVRVIPLAPVLEAYPEPAQDDMQRVRCKYSLPEQFAFYPAQTWPHKNHLRLIEAVALLRDRGLGSVPVVCSGRLNEFHAEIEKRVRTLGLEALVQFIGFVAPLELNCLYRLARCVIVPTRFEAASFPIWEAFLAGCPVACSNVTSLPEQVGDAALLFDPDDPGQIADALLRLWTSPNLRIRLVERGFTRAAANSWGKVARSFQQLYREAVVVHRERAHGRAANIIDDAGVEDRPLR